MDDRGRGRQAYVEILTFMAGKTPRRPVHRENCVRRSTNIKANTPSSTIRCAAVGWRCPELPTPVEYGTVTHVELEGRTVVDMSSSRVFACRVVTEIRSECPLCGSPLCSSRPCQTPGPIGREQRNAHGTREDAIGVVCKSDREDLISLGCLSSVKVTSPLSPAAAMDHVAMPRRVARPSHFHQVARLTHSLQELSIPCGQGTGPV